MRTGLRNSTLPLHEETLYSVGVTSPRNERREAQHEQNEAQPTRAVDDDNPFLAPVGNQPLQTNQGNLGGGINQGNREEQNRIQHPHTRVYPGPPQPLRHPTPGKKNTKAAVKIAALNIKGRGNPDVRHGENKWYHVWQVMREQKIGVLIVGEAHLDDEHKVDVDNLFGRAIRVEFTPDETAPSARAGLAFVLNKSLVETAGVKATEIVPGRAMILNMKNVDGSPLSILGVYAPNRPSENATFWNEIKNYYMNHPRQRKPDVFGGDLNVVEDPLDRLPAHPDSKTATNAFDVMKSYLELVDGFRETYPAARAYTFIQLQNLGGSQSRIDRLYVKRDLFEETFEWDIQAVGINTDHRMVAMKISTADSPTIGHGRWVWPAHIIRDKVLAEFIDSEGLKLMTATAKTAELEKIGQWNPSNNVQTLWMDYKLRIGNKARERAKIVVPKIVEEI
ncbi:Endonuclease/exonuclease/phosphatase, partial [Mycena pura]